MKPEVCVGLTHSLPLSLSRVTTGLTRLVTAFWLLSAVSADLNPYRGVGNLQSEKIFNPCFFWADPKNPSLLSLAQHWETPTPSAILKLHLVDTDSFESEFDLRTFDPEGVVFYGDVEGGVSWFMLALRNGRPEVQVNNQHSSIAVSSGDILSDGKWRKISVKGRDNQITLKVNRRTILDLRILPNVGLESNVINMRIAMGGLLMNESSLLIPLKHSLDACIANWDWLHQNTSWLLKKVASNPNIQCPTNIVPGAFFPGIGMAVFKGSDFLNESDSSVDWSLSFEAVIRPTKHSGVVMAILTGVHDPLVKLEFSIHNRHEHFKLDLGQTTLISVPGPARLCDGHHVRITVSENGATLQVGAQRSAHAVAPGDFAPLRRSWFAKDALMLLGGLPDDEKLGYDWHLFSGCMQDIRLQGTSVDFNQAWFKHNAISSHSCPSAVNQSPINFS